MELITFKANELIPYDNNPRINDDAVEVVAESIRQCGYDSPIVIDENKVILAGHTRLRALKRLGIEDIQCVVVSGLSDEQKKKFRILDNKTNEFALWDMDKLAEELEDLDFEDFDFGFGLDEEEPEEEDDGYYGDARERTLDQYNLHEYDNDETEGYYQMPLLKPCNFIPTDLIGFNYMMSNKDKNVGIHYYVDDYQFERIWNSPMMYIEKLADYQCTLTPDFSLYTEMPIAMMIWNTYRSRLIGQMCQRYGLNVIPTVSWCGRDTFEFCFDGLPKKSTLSISTVGVKQSKEAMSIWKAGVDEMIMRCQPKTLLLYGGSVDYDFGNIKIVEYANKVTERMNASK